MGNRAVALEPAARGAHWVSQAVSHAGNHAGGDANAARFDDADADGADSRPFKVWTRAEAAALRAVEPALSPWRVVAMQAAAGLLCFAIARLLFQRAGVAESALYGAASVVLPSALLARGMTRGSKLGTPGPVASAAGFMFWEMLKVGVAVTMLVIAPRVVANLVWPALLAAMVVCIKVNWVALLWRTRRQDNKATNRHGS